MERLLSAVLRVVSVVLVGWAGAALAAEVAGLTWSVPREWEAQGARPMRVATYRIPAVQGDGEPGELAIFYFGKAEGGGVDANVRRWAGQFQRADGTPLSEKDARPRKETVNGLEVTTVDAAGTYTGGGPMMGPSTPKPGWRLLGAIVQGPEGAIFFKLTGPQRTVAGTEKPFRALLQSVKRAR